MASIGCKIRSMIEFLNKHASNSNILNFKYETLAVVFALFGFSSLAKAQEVSILKYSSAMSARDGFVLSRPIDQGHLRLGGQLHFNYAVNPLVLEGQQGDASTERFSIVEHLAVGNLSLSLGLFDRLTIFGGIPLILAMDGEGEFDGLAADGFGLGDLYAGARVRIFGDSSDLISLGFQAVVFLPTAEAADEDQTLSGDSTASVHPEVLLEINTGLLKVVGNLGVKVRRQEDLVITTETGSELTYGAGVILPVLKEQVQLDAHAELIGTHVLNEVFGREEVNLEAMLGAKLHVPHGWSFGLGFGPGFSRGVGTPDVRFAAMIGWTQPSVNKVDSVTGPCPKCVQKVKDSDGDGLIDSVDKCAQEKGPIENFGCPDSDKDLDLVVDRLDNCPNKAGSVEYQGCLVPQNVALRVDRLEIFDKIYFEFSKAIIDVRSHPMLTNVADVINSHPEIKLIEIQGYTDSRGPAAVNKKLSQDRAEAVVLFLVEKGKVAPERLRAKGFGSEKPIVAKPKSESDHALNRRVEFRFVDSKSDNWVTEPRTMEISDVED